MALQLREDDDRRPVPDMLARQAPDRDAELEERATSGSEGREVHARRRVGAALPFKPDGEVFKKMASWKSHPTYLLNEHNSRAPNVPA